MLPTISHYRILKKIGAGGMGEVYLAEDLRLARKVALKILPEEFTKDDQKVKRFTQEAKAASALNHPNIVTIHDIGQLDSLYFIATEYVEGETLRQHLRHSRMGIREVLDVGVQTASALAAAHQAGIIHRDIKPENLMRRPDGLVKLLDFGLAKLAEPQAIPADTAAPTFAKVDTAPGLLLGTLVYMSPEQARGKDVDARTDIFSFGGLLYEMVTGCPPFAGETPSDVIAAILTQEPQPLSHYAPEAPAELQRLVSKALRTDREERYQTMKELLVDLNSLKQEMEFQEKLERSASPDSGNKDTATATAAGAPTEPVADQPTASAESIADRIKSHRRGALLIALLLAVAIGFGLWYLVSRAATPAQIQSIAVLPFQNASGDADMEYLSDGMTESLISSLSQLPKVDVRASSSVFRFKGKDISLKKAGQDLSVQAVLTGRVLQHGNMLSLYVQLVEVATEKVLWSDSYNRQMSNLTTLQGEIARDVSNKLQVKLSGADEQRVTKSYTTNPEAYQLYLRGRFHWDKRSKQELQKALEYFQQAITADPNYALAYTGLADGYTLLGIGQAREVMPKAKEAALKALSLDDNLAEAHAALGLVLINYDYDFPGSEREFKRALALNPNYATAHQWYGHWLDFQGRFDEGLAEYRRALEIDPFSFAINYNYGINLYLARRYDEAIVQLKKAQELDANSPQPHYLLSSVYYMKGMYPEAVEESAKCNELLGNRQLAALLRERFAKGGIQAYLRALLEEKRQLVSGAVIDAVILTVLGEKDQAFAELNKAYDNHDPLMLNLKVNPYFDPLRDDPRFKELLNRVGFPP